MMMVMMALMMKISMMLTTDVNDDDDKEEEEEKKQRLGYQPSNSHTRGVPFTTAVSFSPPAVARLILCIFPVDVLLSKVSPCLLPALTGFPHGIHVLTLD